MNYLHTMVRISDINQSLDFYCNQLGLIETRRVENPSGRFTLIFLAAPGDIEYAKAHKTPLLELTYNWPDATGNLPDYTTGTCFGHLAFRVANIYTLCERLQDAGITINRPPRDGYMAFIKSPDNISIELLQAGDPLPPCEPWQSMPAQGTW